ncbi:MAG: secG [Devosia sp.]|uniref:preprotein translocase subunit SecG n=1 Tax=Devosia sp. TaxID=1871048 RepID=UPI00260690E0|nr:preprotein translocase subunit SecG [Devosia sp.]MDB5542813.1 secG [Devosia sp.]
MANVLIVAYLLIVIALIAVILLQRSEGGGLGMGSSANGLISVRGSANLLTRTTAILAALFFASAIGLTVLSSVDRGTSGILERAAQGGSTPTTVLDALQNLQQQTGADLPVPAGGAAAPATTPTAPATTTTPATGTAPATTTGGAATPAAPAADPGLAVPTTPAPAATPPATTEQPAAPAN